MDELQDRLREFAEVREWEQFHSPKNLIMALVGEVGELAEIFQWLDDEQSHRLMSDPVKAAHVAEELADVFGYILRLADVLKVDLPKALLDKLEVNDRKYPVAKAKGNARKYTEFVSEETSADIAID
jgi:NTP pyrophosphatase (non-canonical NTP hydrolase)